MSNSAVRIDVRPDNVAVLTLDQAGSRANVLTAALWHELEAALISLRTRIDLGGLVIASAKPGIFIAGADLKFFAGLPGPNDPTVRQFIDLGLRVLFLLESLPFPTCAAIDGAALGGGLEVALACDYRLVGTHPRVELGLPEVTLGLIPGWGGTQRLPRLIGLQHGKAMLRVGKSCDASRAVEQKLVLRQVESGQLIDAAAELLLNLPPETWDGQRRLKYEPMLLPDSTQAPEDSLQTMPAAVREVTKCVNDGVRLLLAEGINLETEAFLRLAGSDESKQLIAAFFAARKKT
ncbi:enoyl-CoA hydratase-related protein [Fimbriiglobus ruber]|uniref:Enoyl-CoA hydratase n=1 Tax=Fimbriiglobus ruber TaxID=1908690 RepID=A0A225E4Z6_9BACT|nr:enoyl-CoA hydratase-related protein [Fimbriiglobus ruber]OWK43487.1 Enoyl-CoA hydratase [Fimbriiglobus ruber]